MHNGSVRSRVDRRRAWVLAAMTALMLPMTACVETVDGTALRGHGAGLTDVAPLDESRLDSVLVGIDEINSIMGATGMEVTGELDEMSDHSADVSDPDCLGAVYGAEAPVYEGTDWTAVRDQVAREPGAGNDHWVEQAVVLYPEERNARDFLESSQAVWRDCANNALGVGDYLWELGAVETADLMLTQVTTQEGADGWSCQHALSLVSNVTVEAWACGYDITDEAARIADAMIRNAAG